MSLRRSHVCFVTQGNTYKLVDFLYLLSQIKKLVSVLPERTLNCFVRGPQASDNTDNGQLAGILSVPIQAEPRCTDAEYSGMAGRIAGHS